jgi:two-component system chemotaxis sensor kinase CheA
LAESFKRLRAEFLAETEETLETLQRDLDRLEVGIASGTPEPEIVDRVFRTTHSLKGVAGMFGLEDMSAVSHALENALDGLRGETLRLDAALVDLLHQGNEALHRLLAAAAKGDDPNASRIARGVIVALDDHLAAHTLRAPEEDEEADTRASTWARLDAGERDDVRRAARERRTVAIVRWEIGSGDFEGSFRDLLTRVRTWGTVHGAAVIERDPESGHGDVRVVASSEEGIFHLLKAVGPLDAEVIGWDLDERLRGEPSEIESETEAVSDAPGGEPLGADRTGSPSSEQGPAETGSLPIGDGAPGASLSREILRVPVERIDRLFSELTDLMQANLGLEATAEGILDWVPDRMRRTLLIQSLRNLDRRIRTMQNEILRMRMVTLSPMYQKLERTVRETVRLTGKEARLVSSGGEEELDKRVVDALTEPLMHLVRNAVDHGIEDAPTRERAGKDATGTVRVTARPDGSHTVIEIADDGAGVDFPKVRERAVALGLVPEGGEPLRDELVDFLFRPGFSLRKEVTEVSGRGVGLDAVRDSVSRLGGLLEVESGKGGTRFRVRLPSILTISQCLLVEAGGDPFFIPLGSVARVERISPERIERVGTGEIVLHGERAVPVRDLGALLGLRGVDRNLDRIPAVILGVANRRLVLLVDRLCGQREVVARSLGDVLPPVAGISGSAQLGDGRTVLILDPATLLEPSSGASPVLGGRS